MRNNAIAFGQEEYVGLRCLRKPASSSSAMRMMMRKSSMGRAPNVVTNTKVALELHAFLSDVASPEFLFTVVKR